MASILSADPLLHWVLDGTVPPKPGRHCLRSVFLPLATLASTLYGIAYRTLQRTDRLFLWYGLLAAFIAWVAPWIVAEYGVVGAAWGISLQPAMLSLLLAWGLNPKNRLSARALAK
ncbi:MAG: hypothetical protein R3E96_09700 [Planctomycetota bacterium]